MKWIWRLYLRYSWSSHHMKHKAACGNRWFIILNRLSVLLCKSEIFQKIHGKQISLYLFILKNTNNNVKLKITHASYVARMLHLNWSFAVEVIETSIECWVLSVVVLTSATYTARLVLIPRHRSSLKIVGRNLQEKNIRITKLFLTIFTVFLLLAYRTNNVATTIGTFSLVEDRCVLRKLLVTCCSFTLHFTSLTPWYISCSARLIARDSNKYSLVAVVSRLMMFNASRIGYVGCNKNWKSHCGAFSRIYLSSSPHYNQWVKGLYLTLKRPGGGVKWTPIGFSDLKFEASEQSKKFQYL